MMMDAMGVYAARWLDRHGRWSDSVAQVLLTRTGAATLDDIDIPIDTTADKTLCKVPAASARTRIAAEPWIPDWRFNRSLGPLLPVEWAQGKPFNATVVDSTGLSSAPVGCVALSTAQLMAYWKHPTEFHGLSGGRIDWDELRRWSGPQWDRETGYSQWDGPMSKAPEATQKLIADILWYIGRGVEMRYSSSNSTAYTYRAVNLLAAAGFARGRAVDYSHSAVVGSLDAGRPVLIDGASHRSEYGSFANAHNWVLDGLIEESLWDVNFIDGHMYEVERFRWYLHNNFGWGGTDNGWYVAGVFDANNNPDMPSSSHTTTPDPKTRLVWEGDHYNYQFMQTLYVDIHVN
jgi:hypothetical protein